MLALLAARAASAGGGGGTSLTYTGTDTALVSESNIVTTPNVPFGQPATARQIVVVLAWSSSANRAPTAVTIGGVTATPDFYAGSVRNGVAIYRATVPAGTSGDVVHTWNATGPTWRMVTYTAPAALTITAARSDIGDGAKTTLTTATPTAPGGTLLVAASAQSMTGVAGIAQLDAPTSANIAIGTTPATGTPSTVTATLTSAWANNLATLVTIAYA